MAPPMTKAAFFFGSANLVLNQSLSWTPSCFSNRRAKKKSTFVSNSKPNPWPKLKNSGREDTVKMLASKTKTRTKAFVRGNCLKDLRPQLFPGELDSRDCKLFKVLRCFYAFIAIAKKVVVILMCFLLCYCCF